MKRTLFLATIMMILSLTSRAQRFNFQAVAPSGQTLYYKITDTGKKQVAVVCPLGYNARNRWSWEGYTKPSGEVKIPAVVFHNGSNYTVVELNEAFYYCEDLTALTIPKTVVKIGTTTFEKCRNLAEIRVEEGNPVFDSRNGCNAIIKTHENELVYGCKNAVIPNTVTSIAWYAFRGSGLTSIHIPPSVEYISGQAFYDCQLTEVTIPATVKGFGADSFDPEVTIKLEGSPLQLEAGMYYSDDEYDDDGFAYSVCVVPCGKRKAFEQSGWAKYFEFSENCDQYDVEVDDEFGCGLKVLTPKAKFGDRVRLTCTPGNYDLVVMNGSYKTHIEVVDNSFIMPAFDVQVKSVKRQRGVEALGGKTLQQVLEKVVKYVSYRFPEGGVHIGESTAGGICIQILADGSFMGGDYHSDAQTYCYRMVVVSDPDEYTISNCPEGWAFVGTEVNGKKEGDNCLVFNRYGKIIYFGSFKDDKPVGDYPMSLDFLEASAFSFGAIEYNNGDLYLGQSIDGNRTGMGLYIWASGDAWLGGWEDDKMNSKGLFKSYSGNYYTATWIKGERID